MKAYYQTLGIRTEEEGDCYSMLQIAMNRKKIRPEISDTDN